MVDHADPNAFVEQVGYDFSEDGLTIDLRFRRANGAIARLKFKHEDLPEIILHMENAVGIANDRRTEVLRHSAPVKVRKVKGIQRSMDYKTPVITLCFDTGLRVDAAFEDHQISEFIAWLQHYQKSISSDQSNTH
jgi:hypothetical protein